MAVIVWLIAAGCQPSHYRKQKDEAAADIIAQKQQEALGRAIARRTTQEPEAQEALCRARVAAAPEEYR